ncbi:MAG: PQQ-dependent sugar dehydrogenase [Kofleriaceae bacterium]
MLAYLFARTHWLAVVVMACGLGSPVPRKLADSCVAPARPASPIRLVRAFPALQFEQPTDLVASPDQAWWYVAERRGRIWRFAAGSGDQRELVLDLGNRVAIWADGLGLLALAIDPSTGALYASYTVRGGTAATSRVSRFTSLDGGATFAPLTEQTLIEVDQITGDHVNADLEFGPDGFLYIGFGDGGPQGDPLGRAQDPMSLKGKILRLDVAGTPYAIPPDNPFALRGGAPEIWALGLRNPWRFTFDRVTGELFAGDVGGDREEEIDRIVRGGNYGWNLCEGTRAWSGSCQASKILAPIVALSHPEVSSITLGIVYRGAAMPELVGRLLYADYASGVVWEIDPAAPNPRMLDADGRAIVAFAADRDGEPIVVDYAGTLWRIVPGAPGNPDVPALLSATGCFTPTGEPATNLIAYEVNTPFWSDGATKQRWLAVPGGTGIAVSGDGHLDLPIGSVLAKEFRIRDVRVETRLFVRHDDGEWAGYTYRWDPTQLDAMLVPRTDPVTWSSWPGKPWYYPRRGECLRCHQAAAGHTLGLELAQLDRGNQLAMFEQARLLAPMPRPPPIQERARAWLDANCSYCHRPGATGQTDMDLRATTPLAAMNVCDVPPRLGTFGIAKARRVAPGDPARSVLAVRIRTRTFARMPPLGSFEYDAEGLQLVEDWIARLTCGHEH